VEEAALWLTATAISASLKESFWNVTAGEARRFSLIGKTYEPRVMLLAWQCPRT
jgi:hypothetical protein